MTWTVAILNHAEGGMFHLADESEARELEALLSDRYEVACYPTSYAEITDTDINLAVVQIAIEEGKI